MKIIVVLTLILRLAGLSGAKKDASTCPLEGQWSVGWGFVNIICIPDENENGLDEQGTLSGDHRYAYSSDAFYPIKGRYTFVGSDVTFGYSIAWSNEQKGNDNKTVSYAGIYKVDDSFITTFWLSITDTDATDPWNDFRVGKSVYNRVQ